MLLFQIEKHILKQFWGETTEKMKKKKQKTLECNSSPYAFVSNNRISIVIMTN